MGPTPGGPLPIPPRRAQGIGIRGLLLFVAIFGVVLGGMIQFVRATRGNEHWIMSVEDQPGGMFIRIGKAASKVPTSIDDPTYKIVVKGYSLGRDIKPFLLDGRSSKLPNECVRTHLDTTLLPGACRLGIGPLFLDFHSAFLEANGALCLPEKQVEVVITPPASEARPVPVGP